MDIKLDKKLNNKILELQSHVMDFFENLKIILIHDTVVKSHFYLNIEDVPSDEFQYKIDIQQEYNNIKKNIGFVGKTYQSVIDEDSANIIENHFKINKSKKAYSKNDVIFKIYEISNLLTYNEGFSDFVALVKVFKDAYKLNITYEISYYSQINISKKNKIDDKIVLDISSSQGKRSINIFINKSLLNNKLYWKMIVFNVLYKNIGFFEKDSFLAASIDNIKNQIEVITY